MIQAAPVFDDESYQGPPAADFENSRAEGVLAFAGMGRGSASNSTSVGSLSATWSDAACKGGGPVDFGFLMGSFSTPDKNKQDVVSGFQPEPRSSEIGKDASAGFLLGNAALVSDKAPAIAEKPVFDGSGKKRGRVDDEDSFMGSRESPSEPPCPPRRPRQKLFGRVEGEDRGPNAMDPPIVRTDVFAWMRSDNPHEDPEVSALLTEEERHTEAMLAHLQPLRDTLYKEMQGHQKEAETSLVTLHPGGYGYFTRTFEGKAYCAHYRCRALAAGAWGEEELVLDENVLEVDPSDGSRHKYCNIRGPIPNPGHNLYAFATDFKGNDAFTLHVAPCGCKERLSVSIARTDGSVHWGLRGDCFYYVVLDAEFRAFSVRCHTIGADPSGAADPILYEEQDQRFNVTVTDTGCHRYLVITVASSETTEVHLLDLQNPDAGMRRVAQRLFAHRYHVDHRGGSLYIVTNKDGVKNSKLCRLPLSALPDVALDDWENVWVPSEGTKIDRCDCFKDFLTLEGRQNGCSKIFVRGYEANEDSIAHHALVFPDASSHSGQISTPRGLRAASAAYSASVGCNPIFDTDVFRYHYSSFTLPELTYEYRVRTREHRLLHKMEIPNFDPNLYRAERIVTERRGVPVSLVYRKDIHPSGLAGGPFPVLLTGYGAYGVCSDPDFDGNRLSLLDRGMVYALAHIRGGGELGRHWYEEGRYMSVKNRFLDFVDAAETLQGLHIAEPGKLAAWGTSSGGLLVAGSMNLRPDLFRAVLLEVPFVDALNTMSDPSIPLTIGEWEEHGNPNEREYFFYMLEYSPYDNIRMEAYPAALVTSSLNDSMVGYWEPLKYVSKLRHVKADRRPVMLKVNFHAGHGAESDRYECLREASHHFAFLLDQLGLSDRSPSGPRSPPR